MKNPKKNSISLLGNMMNIRHDHDERSSWSWTTFIM